MAAALAAGSFGTHELGKLVLRLIKEYGVHMIGAILFKLLVNEVKNLYSSVLKALGVGGGDTVFHNSSVALGRNSTLAHLLPNITLSSAELEIAALIIDPKDISTGFREVGGFRDVKRSLMDSTLSMVAHVEVSAASQLRESCCMDLQDVARLPSRGHWQRRGTSP